MTSDKLRVLLVGNGGREHTLAWKLAQSDQVECIHIVPGNGGTAGVPKSENITTVKDTNFAALVKHAQDNNLNFLVPGPEAPLVAGITDYFHQHAPGIHVFGPSQAAARMEGSKTFSKDFMKRHMIPTAAYENFTDYGAAKNYLEVVSHSVVIKADGLAAGKGVVIPQDASEARHALESIMADREFGDAGNSVVIEELLEGDEISILSLSDGETILSLPPAQDHKRIADGDTGPNTGGMGTYTPTPLVTKEQLEEIDRVVLRPTIDGMKKEGMTFRGCLFTGLMMTKDGPKVLEYNVRFGDPESQSCLALLQSDLAELMLACCTGTLSQHKLSIAPLSACTVVVAAGGYPGSYAKGTPMKVKEAKVEDGVFVFHAGTGLGEDGQLKTSGGRVIAATATGGTLREAVDKAYQGVKLIEFEGMQYRKDIAGRALK
ncbi:Bifunctional purine biosynthetic protein ADE1 [Recurvomyces mirabilis]|uniref:phosphoribosylamine--glycine ligase n=1 Tax=Recurvomyces mirabilis TaxID=574656 RepID=A0AAE1BZQ8_9PEZI|nr:Bifunctional purine biosynthetic protein ADE1 [Recurvomyces mirabilis]KAK5151141.1 Bifunctional purine biosynthetic protein ADE1 [Recurvomyces mirabilis]